LLDAIFDAVGPFGQLQGMVRDFFGISLN